jgi:hypothetical protein
MSNQDAHDVMRRLAEPFGRDEVEFKPGATKGNRALAMAYVDARVIQDRLDEVLGIDGWQDEYQVLEGGSVVCKLRCRLGGEWVTKADVGSQSEQPDGGDRVKAAFSDALKRAAVKFGVGRYLYRQAPQWVDYDPQRRQFVRKPALPGPLARTHPPPAALTASPLCTQQQLDEIAALLARKDRTIEAMFAWLGRPPETPLGTLTQAEYARVKALFEPKGRPARPQAPAAT